MIWERDLGERSGGDQEEIWRYGEMERMISPLWESPGEEEYLPAYLQPSFSVGRGVVVSMVSVSTIEGSSAILDIDWVGNRGRGI